MQKAESKEGPRAPLFCLGAALLISASGTAAQAVEQSDLDRCASLETTELKLACFEALAAIADKEASPAADAAPQPQPESTVAEKSLTSSATATAVAGPDAGSVAPAPATSAGEDRADGADDPGQDQTDQEQTGQEQAELVDEIGREYLDKEKADEKEKTGLRATVSEVVKGGYDVLYLHFTNGQVWRQQESHRFSYPRKGEFDVIINQGMMGEYRLRLDTGGPMIRIRRVK